MKLGIAQMLETEFSLPLEVLRETESQSRKWPSPGFALL